MTKRASRVVEKKRIRNELKRVPPRKVSVSDLPKSQKKLNVKGLEHMQR